MAELDPHVAWRRFVLDDGRESFVELTSAGERIFVRSGHREREPTVEIRTLSSAEAARRGVEKRVATLLRNGYLEDDGVVRPLPDRDTRSDRAEAQARGRASFDEGLPLFVREWRALGFDPARPFVDECRGKGLHPNEVAGQCLALASRIFGVQFSGKTRAYDVEHGDRQSIGRQSAAFYQAPAHVLAIVLRKLQGRSLRSDDIDAPGLADEIAARLRGPSTS